MYSLFVLTCAVGLYYYLAMFGHERLRAAQVVCNLLGSCGNRPHPFVRDFVQRRVLAQSHHCRLDLEATVETVGLCVLFRRMGVSNPLPPRTYKPGQQSCALV